MILLGLAEQIRAACGPLREAVLARHPDWGDLIAPIPVEAPGAVYWTAMIDQTPRRLSEVGDAEDAALLDAAFDPIHLSLRRRRTFVLVDTPGVFPPLPDEEIPLVRLGVRARGFYDWVKKHLPEERAVEPKEGDWEDLMGRHGWCLATAEADGKQYPGPNPKNREGWLLSIHDIYRRCGLLLNGFACGQLFQLLGLDPAQTPALQAYGLVDLLSIAVVYLYGADDRTDHARLPTAWAEYTSAAAAFKATEFMILLADHKSSDEVSASAGIWRANTTARFAAIPSIIRADPRIAPLAEAVETLLPGMSESDQRLASLGVEVLEYLSQTRIAHHAVQHYSVWKLV